eukprot:227114-Amphidinium_carterae.2
MPNGATTKPTRCPRSFNLRGVEEIGDECKLDRSREQFRSALFTGNWFYCAVDPPRNYAISKPHH